MSMMLRLCRRSPSALAGYAKRGFDPDDLSADEPSDNAMQAQADVTRAWLDDPAASAALTPQARKQYEDYIRTMEKSAKRSARQSGQVAKPADVLDLAKSWHVLHFVLTGSAQESAAPAGLLLSGGQEVGEDLGYGPARVVSPEETARLAAHLAGLDIETEAAQADGDAMRLFEVYAAPQDSGELVAEVRDALQRLRDYCALAASKGEGLVIWMD